MKTCIATHIFLVAILYSSCVNTTLSKSDRVKSKIGKYKYKSGPQSANVSTRHLINSEPSAKEILIEHNTYFEKITEKNFKGKVLGYVTPWNSHGYVVAKNFTAKFSFISPVWLQIKRKGNLKYECTGKHDIDLKWIADLKKHNKDIKIVPRILFDGWTVDDYSSLFINPKEQLALINIITETCKSFKFNGVVLELWTQIAGNLRSDILTDFVNLIASKLKSNSFDLILVVPPVRGQKNELFTAEHFNELADSVSFFSLMTYDYSNPQRPGPNSPIKWAKSCVETLVPDNQDRRRSKILLGLNFYGYDYTVSGGGPIVGHDFIRLLKDYKGKLKLDDNSVENFFEVRTNNGKHVVFFPTLYSISERIKLAEDLNTGISIWELGQGLEYFYDLL